MPQRPKKTRITLLQSPPGNKELSEFRKIDLHFLPATQTILQHIAAGWLLFIVATPVIDAPLPVANALTVGAEQMQCERKSSLHFMHFILDTSKF